MPHLRVLGKGSKVRYVPAHPLALERIHDYLAAAGHGEDADGPLFRPLKNPAGQGRTDRPLTHGAIYHQVLRNIEYRNFLSDLGPPVRPCRRPLF